MAIQQIDLHAPNPECDCQSCALHERDRLRAAIHLTRDTEIETGKTDRSFQTSNACDQLTRYGGSVYDDSLLDALFSFSNLNDDLWHGRHETIIYDDVVKIKQLLDNVLLKNVKKPSD